MKLKNTKILSKRFFMKSKENTETLPQEFSKKNLVKDVVETTFYKLFIITRIL